MPNIQAFHEWLRDEHPELPPLRMHKEVCPQCRGTGTSVAYLGAYTESDRAEMGHEWYEFMDDVRAGRYDRTCETCNGQNVVDVVDEDPSSPTVKHWIEWVRDEYETEAIYRMERMMGA